jgi:hypothetical protein
MEEKHAAVVCQINVFFSFKAFAGKKVKKFFKKEG